MRKLRPLPFGRAAPRTPPRQRGKRSRRSPAPASVSAPSISSAILTGEANEAVNRRGTTGSRPSASARAWQSGTGARCSASSMPPAISQIDFEHFGAWTITPAGRELLFGRASFARRPDAALAPTKQGAAGRRARAGRRRSGTSCRPEGAPPRRSPRRTGSLPSSFSPTARSSPWPRCRPTSLEELAAVHGVGAKKLDTYGDAFLQVLRDHAQVRAAREPPRDHPHRRRLHARLSRHGARAGAGARARSHRCGAARPDRAPRQRRPFARSGRRAPSTCRPSRCSSR